MSDFIFWAQIIGLMVFVGTILIVGYLTERKLWNGGYCRKCGAPMAGFDTASDGSRGYNCIAEFRHPSVWISYPGIVGDIGERG